MLEAFFERLIVRAATVDELLSDAFEPLPGQKSDTDLAARRLAAWCRACASGDWRQFARRLARDGWDFPQVLERLATVRRNPAAPVPAWIDDAMWITAALSSEADPAAVTESGQPCAFEDLYAPLLDAADAQLWSSIDAGVASDLTDSGRASLRLALLRQLSELCTPAIYALFDSTRTATPPSSYPQFVAEMKADGFGRLFDTKPVLLRLIATITRQWIEVSRELLTRLHTDLPAICDQLLTTTAPHRVARIEGDLGDPHNGGRSVRILVFDNGTRIVYKPKDLRVDVALHTLIDRLNNATPPLQLRAIHTLARDGYGWCEFIEHTPCTDPRDFPRYFARAGAWLALFYCLAAGDMHQENIIAAGEHPTPIDIETVLEASLDDPEAVDPESYAFHDAMEIVADSAMTVGLIPSYERSPENKVYAIGGLVSAWNVKAAIRWDDVNTDSMRPVRSTEARETTPNLPHVGGRYAAFADHLDDFVSGFEEYVEFLARWNADTATGGLLDGFAGLPVRDVPRPTRFYSALLHRLKDHRSMDDGAMWSAQADFVARLSDWSEDGDPRWPLLRAERSALLTLNVPFFVMHSDQTDIRDCTGLVFRAHGVPGVDRALNRCRKLDRNEIDWQVTVIRQNIESFRRPAEPSAAPVESRSDGDGVPTRALFAAEADRIAAELSRYAIRRGPSAAWIALDWLGDSEAFQLICLGPELYNGVSGIAVFLAAHAAVTGCTPSKELALAAVAQLHKQLNGRSAARLARQLGVGGGAGMGSIVYALAVMSKLLQDDGLLTDAHAAAALITGDLIAADTKLDVLGGSAGAILGLLRLYRDSHSDDALTRATQCGEHLLRAPRVGPEGRRSWGTQSTRQQGLTGMSHGAAGYAYALASLAAATGRDEFAQAATECLAFENANFDPHRHTWPDLRFDGETYWPSQWCHGAPGIGLARIGMARLQQADTSMLETDIRNAVVAVESGWPGQQRDTLCCGALGSVEFFAEAATELNRRELRELASRRLMNVVVAATKRGDYRWTAGDRRFNPGLFRGLAGVGYTALREVDDSLPNILFWE